ncbi:MAG: ASCH domain protein [Pelotomaculum sp. PtaB.Bin104]|nr:MAG: ASCH domain protein [Pelotomaculum sp. PtaB.Bin104]
MRGGGNCVKIPALTLWQPWASLVAVGAKKIETRSWSTSYRGPLAIHAAKTFTREARTLCLEESFQAMLYNAGINSKNKLPLRFGSILCICRLVDCVKVEQTDGLMAWLERGYVANDYEYSFGDYTPGRYAWILNDVRRLPEPIPAKGRQGLWYWEVPEGVLLP